MKKYFWRIETTATASKKACEYIRSCGSTCTPYTPTALGAQRIAAKLSGCSIKEFAVIHKGQ